MTQIRAQYNHRSKITCIVETMREMLHWLHKAIRHWGNGCSTNLPSYRSTFSSLATKTWCRSSQNTQDFFKNHYRWVFLPITPTMANSGKKWGGMGYYVHLFGPASLDWRRVLCNQLRQSAYQYLNCSFQAWALHVDVSRANHSFRCQSVTKVLILPTIGYLRFFASS